VLPLQARLAVQAFSNRILKNKHHAVSQGNISSKLKGKDPIRSAFSFELPVAFMRAVTKAAQRRITA